MAMHPSILAACYLRWASASVRHGPSGKITTNILPRAARGHLGIAGIPNRLEASGRAGEGHGSRSMAACADRDTQVPTTVILNCKRFPLRAGRLDSNYSGPSGGEGTDPWDPKDSSPGQARQRNGVVGQRAGARGRARKRPDRPGLSSHSLHLENRGVDQHEGVNKCVSE